MKIRIDDLPKTLVLLALYEHALSHGPQIARTLGSLTGTKLVFRMDSHGAKQMADLFGEQEILERNESISFGAHQMREGVSLTDHQKVRPLISPADLMKLDNFEAFLKFPRNLPATKVKFDLQNISSIVSEYVSQENHD